jgi:hypothetical protein
MLNPLPDARKAEILALAESTPNRTLIPVGEAAALVRENTALRARLDAAERDFELMRVFAYGFARHIRNVKDLPATQWGLLGLDLLADLHAVNPERYDREVTALAARGREAGEVSK